MGRVGAASDNTAMESWFGLLQNNVLDRNDWATRTKLRTEITWWIEAVYLKLLCNHRPRPSFHH